MLLAPPFQVRQPDTCLLLQQLQQPQLLQLVQQQQVGDTMMVYWNGILVARQQGVAAQVRSNRQVHC